MRPFYWIIVYIFKGYFYLFHRLRVHGLNNLPKGAAIIAPNHASYWDPPLIGAACPEMIAYLAKKRLFDVPILSWGIRNLNAYPVTGTGTDLNSIKLICQLLKEGKKVVIFPEGKRANDGKLGDIRTGVAMLAQRSGAPIVPVYIDGAYEVWPNSRKFPKLWGKITVTFGEPIYPDGLSKDDIIKKLANSLEKMAKK